MKTRDRKPLFERLKKGLNEGLAHAKGELTLRTVPIPDPPPEIDAETLASVRAQSAMSQRVFARMLNVSPKTLQSWEQGVRQPSDASRRLLQVFCEEPGVLCRIAGLPVVHLSGIRMKTLPSGIRRIVISR
jgi:putative transcriptional regulator